MTAVIPCHPRESGEKAGIQRFGSGYAGLGDHHLQSEGIRSACGAGRVGDGVICCYRSPIHRWRNFSFSPYDPSLFVSAFVASVWKVPVLVGTVRVLFRVLRVLTLISAGVVTYGVHSLRIERVRFARLASGLPRSNRVGAYRHRADTVKAQRPCVLGREIGVFRPGTVRDGPGGGSTAWPAHCAIARMQGMARRIGRAVATMARLSPPRCRTLTPAAARSRGRTRGRPAPSPCAARPGRRCRTSCPARRDGAPRRRSPGSCPYSGPRRRRS